MNRIINLLIVFLLLLTTGCSKERLSSPGDDFEQKGSASLSLSFVRSGGTSDPLGESILNTVRIIAFASNSNGGDLNAPILNKLYVGSGTDRISINEIVPAGYLNIYLVGNELASDNDRFSNITSIDNLKALMWDYNANSEYLVPAFPMFSAYKRIRINVNGEIEGMTPNSGTSNEYTFHIERAVAKVEVKVNCNFADDLGGVKIQLDKAAVKQLPYESYPFAREYDGPEDDYFDLSEINLEEGTHLTTDGEGFEISDGKLVFYVPEHLTSQSKKYTYLELSGSLIQNPGMRLTYKVPLGDGLSFYSPKQLIEDHGSMAIESYYLHRNNHYILSLNIKSLGDMDGVFVNQMVKPWQTVNVDGSSAAPYLNVSTVNTTINDFTVQRVYFWTNQRDVKLETIGKLSATNGPDFTVNHIFEELAGEGASNFSFVFDNVRGSGKGHFDLISSQAAPNEKYMLYLNSNNLRREIAVTSNVPVLRSWDARPYVGTFHRASETGERVIYVDHAGEWTAEVEDPNGQGHFVILDGVLGTDPKLKTDNPGDAESFQLTGNAKIVRGKGRIAFRVGMTSKYNATESAPARYARIKLTHKASLDNGISYLYVRQGEDPDYLMRPGDTDGSGAAMPDNRAFSVRFSPYNLTAPNMTTGGMGVSSHPQLSARGGAFVKYPTQAGALFQWAIPNGFGQMNRAYNPINPIGPISASTVSTSSTTDVYRMPHFDDFGFWDDLKQNQETCPAGYKLSTGALASFRRPNAGSTDEKHEFTNSTNEMVQSLFLNPTMRSTPVVEPNTVRGCYADGFFDRRPMVDALDGGLDRVVNGVNNYDIAYRGVLFVNPYNKASLFFPGTGFRRPESISMTSSVGWYWTATIDGIPPRPGYPEQILCAFTIFISTVEAHELTPIYISDFGSIRCIRE